MQWRMAGLISTMTLTVMACIGCGAGQLIGGMAQNYEYQKRIEVLAEYDGLKDQSVAVVVDADLSTLYEYPELVANVTGGVTNRISRDVPGARVLPAVNVLAWQYHTPQWNAMPYGDIAEELNVDRVVYVDIYEFRLHPPGNRWEWEGVCAANVGVIERGSLAHDTFAANFTVHSEFPTMKGVDRDSADASSIEYGLMHRFIQRTAWLFHTHLEPKYPDRFRGELEQELSSR